MSRRLDDLSPKMRPLADQFLAKLVEAKIPVLIITTSRTLEEQRKAVEAGTSWTMNSRHLSGNAIDVVPYETYVLRGGVRLQWDDKDPVWQKIGAIGQALGLKWGVVRNGKRIDLGHFEI
jgi:hypothetical protein